MLIARQLTGRFRTLLVGGITMLVFGSAGSSRAVGAVHGWSRIGVGAVTQPAPVDGKLIVYSQHAGMLEVIALNPADGATDWRVPATASFVTPGVSPVLAVLRRAIFYLEPGGAQAGLARVVARDASGRVVWQSGLGAFESWPAICPDQPTEICISGQLGTNFGELRLSAETGKLMTVARLGTLADPGRDIGEDLYDAGSRHPEQLEAVLGGHIAWRRNLSSIFTLPHASTDGGWNIDRYSKLGLFVGSVGIEPVIKNGRATIDLSQTMTAGFSTATGAVAWRTSGYYMCEILPCAGQPNGSYTSPSGYGAPSVGVRVVETGTEIESTSGTKPITSPNASAVIQGFHPGTGKTAWSFTVGRDISGINESGLPEVGAATIVLPAHSRYVALNLRTGATKHLHAGTPAWCERPIEYTLKNSPFARSPGGDRYVGQFAVSPCTLAGASSPIPARIPQFAAQHGAIADGLAVWTETGGVYAAPS